jgi:transcriptional regulator of acetoin/glycerol metabolism
MTEKNQIIANDFSFSNKSLPKNAANESFNLAENEKQIILKAIQKFKGNMSHTAKELGINRSTLYDKMKKYDL